MKLIPALIVVCALFSGGCGYQADEAVINITYTETLEELWTHGGDGKSVGRANWNDIKGVRRCSIYVMYMEWYELESCYNEVLGHETRHCFEGEFHGDEPSTDMSTECNAITTKKIYENSISDQEDSEWIGETGNLQ